MRAYMIYDREDNNVYPMLVSASAYLLQVGRLGIRLDGLNVG